MSPSGRVPFIRANKFVVADVDPIVAFVNTKVCASFIFNLVIFSAYFSGYYFNAAPGCSTKSGYESLYEFGQQCSWKCRGKLYNNFDEKKVHLIFVFQAYLCWLDNVTYNEVTKPRYGSAYPWPLNHILTWQKKQAIYKKLAALGWTSKTLEEVTNNFSFPEQKCTTPSSFFSQN